MGDAWDANFAVCGLALPLVDLGRRGEATAALAEWHGLLAELGPWGWRADWLAATAALAVVAGQPEPAARLLGAAVGLREDFGVPFERPWRERYDRLTSDLRAGLGDAVFSRAWTAGRGMAPEEAIAEALALVARSAG